MTNRKLKLAGILTAGICLLLSGCAGTEKEAPDTEQQTETASAEPQAQQEEAQNATAQEATETESAETAETAAPAAEKEPEIIWYMDEEGYKNDILGVTLKKDKAEEAEAELSAKITTYIYTASNMRSESETTIQCKYYDGTLEEYVAQEGLKNISNAELEGVSYVYGTDDSSHYVAAWVNNGIVVNLTNYDMTNVPAQLEKTFHKFEVNAENNNLLYFTEDGLYIPAVGIKMEWDDSKKPDSYLNFELSLSSFDEENTVGIGIYTKNYYDSYMGMSDDVSAKEIIDDYIQNNKANIVGEMENINFGKCAFVGQKIKISKSYSESYSSKWATDDCDYIIQFSKMPVDSEKTETDYLSIFE